MSNKLKKTVNADKTEQPLNVLRNPNQQEWDALVKASNDLMGTRSKKTVKPKSDNGHKKNYHKPRRNRNEADEHGRFSYQQEKELAWINQAGAIIGGVFMAVGGVCSVIASINDTRNISKRQKGNRG